MDRIIQPYGSASSGVSIPPRAGSHHALVPQLQHAKSPGDFARALRRRMWVVLFIALSVSLGGSAFIVRMPAIYQADAEIEIVPPHFDPALTVIVDSAASYNRDNTEQFVLNLIAQLHGKNLAESVARDFGAGQGSGDPAAELLGGLTTKRVQGTAFFQVFLEGRDPDRVAKLLNALLVGFVNKTKDDSQQTIDESIRLARESLSKFYNERKKIDADINKLLAETSLFAPGGRNIVEEEYLNLKSVLLQKKIRFEDLMYERRLVEMWPNLRAQAVPSPDDGRIAELIKYKQNLDEKLEYLQRTVRDFQNDAYARRLTRQLNGVIGEIERLRAAQAQTVAAPDMTAMTLTRAGEEIQKLERELETQQGRLHASLPQYESYISLIKLREQTEQLIAATQERLAKFEILAGSQKAPVEIRQRAVDPIAPVRPNRPLLIGLVSILGLGLGIGLVCLLEQLDHSVKVPEQLTLGLTLPLFGVVPRMRRLSAMQRGGHLWTPSVPDSIDADAYRNIRASLIGAERSGERIVTLLVTSAKAGEGKSTTALNLAATCARAGERTILVDCDLRRPSLAEVFDAEPNLGLVDVLRSEMPWQRAVVRTEVTNLSFLPCGDPSGVPIEILGSLELRQLITALSGHYHRVILDGPAVLGLADCRMLGQFADATLLVVRSGAHELRPLRRAKEMLEQSRVRIAGLVFNSLSEDLNNWSSDYAIGTIAGSLPGELSDRPPSTTRGLDAPSTRPAATATGGRAED